MLIFFSFFNIEFRFISQQEAPRESSIAAVGATTVLLGQVWEYGPPPDRSCTRTKKVKNKCIQKKATCTFFPDFKKGMNPYL